MAHKRETTTNTSNGLDPHVSAALDRHPIHPPLPKKETESKKPSGSKACDPITVRDDDDLDAAEINYFDLEDDNEDSNKRNYAVPIKHAVVDTHGSGFQSVPQSHSPYNDTQGPAAARHTEKLGQPLFRALTKDDLSASYVRSVPENCTTGFKASYGAHDFDHTRNAALAMQQKRTSRNPSVALFNEERTKNKTGRDRDAPQFAMSVLNSKRKRTMGELGYDELISPTQIESPSEKLARMAKRRRQRQERCDLLSQDTDAGETQSTVNFDYSYGHEQDRMTRKSVEFAGSSVAYESLDKQGIISRVGDKRTGPSVVYENSPVSPRLPTESNRDQIPTRRRDDHSDGHMATYRIHSIQATAQDHDVQEHRDGINAACLGDSASRNHGNLRTRIAGPTKACGVFSREKKAPVKRSNQGAFHCPRCDSQFTTSQGVNYHFEGCVMKYGNPKRLKWNDHPSLQGVAKRAVPTSKGPHTKTESQMSAALEGSTQSNVPTGHPKASGSVPIESQTIPTHASVDTQRGVLAPIGKMRTSLLESDTQTPTLSDVPEVRPTIEPEARSSYKQAELGHPELPVEHHAIAGKGLSQQTLERFQETGDWNSVLNLDQNADEAQAKDEEAEVPNIAYRYFVQKREWLETEEDAIELSLGPYHTMDEANAVAKAEVQFPQIDGFEGVCSKGWSYLFQQDEFGMQTHIATILEVHIETVVTREIAPANARVPIPMSAFIVAQHVYVVHELQWLTSPDSAMSAAPTHCQSLTHGVFTLLKRANRRAAAEYLESLTGNWGSCEYDQLKKAELNSDLDKKVGGLNRENECFSERIELDNNGFAKVWVEEVVVEGPRN